ncbi:oxygen-independent coproporphyrinogen III oxidase [Asticcacaulis sp. BYS171W]|uniref:Coproporphyrinogen-III oxidase n=1 Tax=Asticcacaulis aquaticus TaxID=2984212 RepID=A0ABT5HTJ3_9CAUL|nr:oxygen-independent coproporphyrinogen III oxidase [Asticcacaulis aquaticus]MDC7683387.1 oxygen-independent coproporphyrinogen III oxidase [Asticcacaulis aquaticus]
MPATVLHKNWPHKSWQDHDVARFLGREAPRYTSYPSAHHFGEMTPTVYGDWLAQMTPQRSIALYLHIPFCEQMCHFCGCNTRATRRYDPVATYVNSLITEINMVSDRLNFRPRVHSIHFGGGSPSMLTPGDLGHIMEALHQRFDLTMDAELSIELDPRRVTLSKVKTYAALGFNRVSLGLQDTDPVVQQLINRIQPIELIRSVMQMLRDNGLSAIGLDLVYGLPGQSPESLQRTLAHVADLDPARISAFSYAHVPWVKKHQTLIDTATLPDTDDKVQMYLALTAFFDARGYRAIGIDHFAKPDDELARAFEAGTMRRNFMGYSTLPNDDLLGFGASSIGELEGGIVQNIPQSTTYQNRLAEGVLPTVRGWAYRADDKLRKAVISDLMCYFRADIPAILARHGYAADYLDGDIAGLADFAEAGIVSVTDRVVTFHSPLKMLVRNVACAFDAYARQSDTQNRYSKVA